MNHISIINTLLKKCFSNANVLNDAKLTSDIDSSISDIITKDIPQQLSLMLNYINTQSSQLVLIL